MVLRVIIPKNWMEKVMFLLLIHDLEWGFMLEILGCWWWKKLHSHDRRVSIYRKNNEPPSRSNICEYERIRGWSLKRAESWGKICKSDWRTGTLIIWKCQSIIILIISVQRCIRKFIKWVQLWKLTEELIQESVERAYSLKFWPSVGQLNPEEATCFHGWFW